MLVVSDKTVYKLEPCATMYIRLVWDGPYSSRTVDLTVLQLGGSLGCRDRTFINEAIDDLVFNRLDKRESTI